MHFILGHAITIGIAFYLHTCKQKCFYSKNKIKILLITIRVKSLAPGMIVGVSSFLSVLVVVIPPASATSLLVIAVAGPITSSFPASLVSVISIPVLIPLVASPPVFNNRWLALRHLQVFLILRILCCEAVRKHLLIGLLYITGVRHSEEEKIYK